MARVGVQFEIDADGILRVLARNLATGREQRVTVKSAVDVSDDAVEKMVAESAEHAFADMAARRWTETALKAGDLGLPYKHAAAGPADGGFDCSGFLSYVLNGAGLRGVPRQANNFYVWVRKAGTFRAVVSRREDTFEMDELRPGDLLFWTGTYGVDRDPPVTHVMIYLGRRVSDGKRVMAGASSGRRYEGEARDGGGVFDFWMPTRNGTNDTSQFIGYGAIPGLR